MKRHSLIALLSLVLVASVSAQIHVKDVSGSFPGGLPSAANLAIVSDGTTGAIKPTVVTIAPTTGNMSGMTDITATGTVQSDALRGDAIASESGSTYTTATHGLAIPYNKRIHYQGAAGIESMALVPVKSDGTAPAAAADAVALSVKLAASPASGESVEVLRVTSASGLVFGNIATDKDWLVSGEDSTDAQYWSDTNNPFVWKVNNSARFAVTNGGAASYAALYVDLSGTGSESKLYLSNVAGNAGSSIQARSALGTEATPYDSVSVFLPGSPALPSSVEGMRITSSQVLVGVAGSGATPAYSWVGDPNTGLSASGDVLYIGTNGSNRALFSASYGMASLHGAYVDQGGTGSESEYGFGGSAGSTSTGWTAKIEMSDSSGAASAPYDSFSFKLSNMGAPSSIEAMRITSATVYIPKGLRHAADTTLTIVSDAVTVTQVEHALAGEGSNDDTLATINGGVEGDMVVFRVAADEDITVVETGNIIVPGASVVLTGSSYDRLTLRYDGTKWVCVSFSDNT